MGPAMSSMSTDSVRGSRDSIPVTRPRSLASGKTGQPGVVVPRGEILDLGPSTVLDRSVARNSDMKGPLVTVAAVVGVLIVGVLIYALSGDSQTFAPEPAVASVTSESTANVAPAPNVPEPAANGPETTSSIGSIPQEVADATRRIPKPNSVSPESDISGPVAPKASVVTQQPPKTSNTENDSAKTGNDETILPPTSQILSLAGLEKQIELPQLDGNKTAASSDTDAVQTDSKLGAVSEFTLQQLQLAIAQPTLTRFAGTEFYLREDADERQLKVWQIRLKKEAEQSEGSALNQLVSGFDKLVATICFDEGYLKFAWEVIEERQFAEQLRNCILLCTAGSERSRIQLRPVIDVGQFITDLSERNVLYELDELALPASEALQLRVRNVNLPATDFEVNPNEGLAGFGDEVEIKLTGWQGDASLRFALAGSEAKPVVRFTPRYKIGTKRNAPLTSQDVRDAIEKTRDSLVELRASLSDAQSAERALPNRIDAALGRMNAANAAAVKAEVGNMQRQLRRARGTIRRATRAIPDMEGTIAGLEQLANVARRFDQHGTIEFEVVVPCNDGEVVLLSTSDRRLP